MMQKDYILRMIQQLSRVLIQILHLREIKDYEGALTYIDDVFKQALGFSSDLITSVPDETLLAMFTSFDVLDIEKCFLVANLLKAEGDIYVDQDNFDTSYYRYSRSLYLFLAILLSDSSINDPDIFLEVEGLFRKKDTELVAGNFSCEEARDGLAQLKNMHS